MLSMFAGALNATHTFLHLMRAKVAPDKSYNFASCLKARNWLKETMWKHIDSSIHVITDFRYLGAHTTTRQATNSSTLTNNMGKRRSSNLESSGSAQPKLKRKQQSSYQRSMREPCTESKRPELHQQK